MHMAAGVGGRFARPKQGAAVYSGGGGGTWNSSSIYKGANSQDARSQPQAETTLNRVAALTASECRLADH